MASVYILYTLGKQKFIYIHLKYINNLCLVGTKSAHLHINTL